MNRVSPKIREKLRLAFLKAELELLYADNAFMTAAEKTESNEDFRKLCQFAEQLLSGRKNPSASQLRQSKFKPDRRDSSRE